MHRARRRGKRCRFCHGLFSPDPRLGHRQVACSTAACQEARKHESQAAWLQRNPDYFTGRYPKVKQWLDDHPGYLADYRRRHPDRVQRDNVRRKVRHQLDREARADMQDSIVLQAPISKQLRSLLVRPPNADIQDSIWPQVVLTSIFSSRFVSRLRRRYTRLDRLGKAPSLSSRA
jgi:hypothetical protein